MHNTLGIEHRHFKGGRYFLLGHARHEQSMEMMVVYLDPSTGLVWTREAQVWNAIVEWPDGEMRPRFVPIDPLC